jgi:hypothetical protein
MFRANACRIEHGQVEGDWILDTNGFLSFFPIGAPTYIYIYIYNHISYHAFLYSIYSDRHRDSDCRDNNRHTILSARYTDYTVHSTHRLHSTQTTYHKP